MTPLSQLLRAKIADDHQEIEQTPIVLSMMNGSITRDRYRNLLAQLLPVHEACDANVISLAIPDLANACQRSETIQADLTFFGRVGSTVTHPAAVEFTLLIPGLSKTALLGVAYVVAGSRMGSRVLEPLLRRGLSLADSNGLTYHQTPPQFALQWRQILTALDLLDLTRLEQDDVVNAAAFCMHSLLVIFRDA